jgi:hypothetical protein
LYSKLVPAGKLIVVDHRGFDDVYLAAESAGADAVSQFPSCGMDPTILMVSPTEVVLFELKVTATVAIGVAQPVADVLGTALLDMVGVADLLEGDGFGLEPLSALAILISAQVR